MQPLEADEPAGIGPYRLLGRLGSGGMGRVYLGRSAGGRTVAVKTVHPHFALDEEFRARFRREVEAARRVGGAWTARVLDADPDAPVPWVATAYAAGPSLAAAVTGSGPLPAHTVRALGAGLAEALAAVHELGLVHRDVKPSNVLLTLDGPLLIDFGIARAMAGTASLTSTGVSVGSPGYMSPEQILGKGVSGAADVFSLGAVLACASVGEPPFRGDSSAALLYKVVHEEPELGSLDGEMRELVAACLAKDPAARPAPAEVGRRLAPEGTARLIAGGWLPGALVEQVSRSAVRLLNLDTGEAARSGPVNFSSLSLAKGDPGANSTREPGPVGVGERGPVGTEPGPVGVGERGPVGFGEPGPVGVGSAGSAGRVAPLWAGEFGPAPVGASAAVPPPQDVPPPGRLSPSVAAASTPTEGGRGRRLSCTVALAVAGVLAVATVGLGTLARPWFQGGGDTSAGGDTAHSPVPTAGGSVRSPAPTTGGAADSPAPSASAASPGGQGDQPATLPARYLGTWEGQATGLGGALPMGTFRLTVQQARVGREMGRLRQTDQLGAVCDDTLLLKKVTGNRILATSVGAAGNHAGCNPTPHQVELTPVGDDLRYTSDSSDEGRPVSRMSKVR
ncbi:protein kinase [Streptomyces sp. NPDC048514]|uniref:serine/threonine-protein kinase n=1 Tax=Streptomyces sp. NPDC048514 TaxID=3365564 RepID=UPI0037242538